MGCGSSTDPVQQPANLGVTAQALAVERVTIQNAALDAENAKLRATLAELGAHSSSQLPQLFMPTETSCFAKQREMFHSKAFIVFAANELDKAYCVLEGVVHSPMDEHQKEQIGCCWAPIPAADAFAHQMAFRYVLEHSSDPGSELSRKDSLSMLGGLNTVLPPVEKQGQAELALLEQGYREALRKLTFTSNLRGEEIYLAVNCAHLAFRSGLPFRKMHSSDYGPLLSETRNKPVCSLTQLDREKAFTLICKAAKLIVDYLDRHNPPFSHRQGMAVFLGGSCNPTSWRHDVAIPLLEAAGTSYYNPQVANWNPELVDIEARAKARASILLFVIDKQTRALASMIEASEYISAGRKLVLVVQEVESGATIGSDKIDAAEAKDLNRARSYLRDVACRHGTDVHDNVAEAVQSVIAMSKTIDE